MATIKLGKKPAATVSVDHIESGKTIASDTKDVSNELPPVVSQSSAPWCTVGVEASFTHNLGNYQSCRVGVRIDMPCPHSEVDATYEYAKEWVDARLSALNDEIQNGNA